MNEKTIHIIIGTKAELIKMSPVLRELDRRKIRYNYIDTSQHTEITQKSRKVLEVREPDILIGQTRKNISAIMQGFVWIWNVVDGLSKKSTFKNKKGLTLVIGDTATTFLGAFMSRLHGIKVGHIEAGLRSHSFIHPFPEEIVRVTVSKMSDYMFAPYKWAYDNLKGEKGLRFNTRYNTISDTIKFAVNKNKKPKLPKKYALVTTHRFETIFNRERLEKVVNIMERAAKKIPVLFVMHDPTRKRLAEYGLLEKIEKNPGIIIAPIYGYLEWVQVEKNAEFILIDGGSIQEESYYLNVPCCLLRNKTERREGLGENVLISELKDEKINYFLDNYKKFRRKKFNPNFSPSKYIVDLIVEKALINK